MTGPGQIGHMKITMTRKSVRIGLPNATAQVESEDNPHMPIPTEKLTGDPAQLNNIY